MDAEKNRSNRVSPAPGRRERDEAPACARQLQLRQELADMPPKEQIEALWPERPIQLVGIACDEHGHSARTTGHVQTKNADKDPGLSTDSTDEIEMLLEHGFNQIEQVRQDYEGSAEAMANAAATGVSSFSSTLLGALERLQAWKESELDRTLLIKTGFDAFLIAGLDTGVDVVMELVAGSNPGLGILAGVAFNGITAALEMDQQAEDNAAIRQARFLDRSAYTTSVALVDHFLNNQTNHVGNIFYQLGRMDEAYDDIVHPESGELGELNLVQSHIEAKERAGALTSEEQSLLQTRLSRLEDQVGEFFDRKDRCSAAIDSMCSAVETLSRVADTGFGSLLNSYLQYRSTGEPVRATYTLRLDGTAGEVAYSMNCGSVSVGGQSSSELAPETAAHLAGHTLASLGNLGIAAEASIVGPRGPIQWSLGRGGRGDVIRIEQSRDGRRTYGFGMATCYICDPVPRDIGPLPWADFFDTLIASCPLTGTVDGMYVW